MNTPLEQAIKTSLVKPIEKKERLSAEIVAILNKQIVNEMYSCNLYKRMSVWMDANNYVNGAKLFLKYGNEETSHADKVIDYLYDVNCTPEIPAVAKPDITAKSVRDILNASLEHEMKVSEEWKAIAVAALKESDVKTFHFAQWFIGEQIEEENKFRDLLFLLNLNLPEWELEDKFKEMIG